MKYRIEEVPNRDVLHVHIDKRLMRGRIFHFDSPESLDEKDDMLNVNCPKDLKDLAKRLFEIDGMEDIFMGQHDIHLGKGSTFTWNEILPKALDVIKAVIAPDEEMEEMEKIAMSDEEAARQREEANSSMRD